MPVVVGFTVETDGRLPDGTPLGDAVQQTHEATDGVAAHLLVNCASDSLRADVLDPTATWTSRVRLSGRTRHA